MLGCPIYRVCYPKRKLCHSAELVLKHNTKVASTVSYSFLGSLPESTQRELFELESVI